jgi:hypothetical protein
MPQAGRETSHGQDRVVNGTDGEGPAPGERRFVFVVALLLTVVSSLPYLAGWTHDDPTSRFDGVMAFEHDTNSYMAYMRQASEGAFLFTNPFTPEPHEPALFNLEWMVGGWIAALPGSSPVVAFHVLRVLGIFAMCFGVAALLRQLFATTLMRRVVLGTLLIGGGFGWLLQFDALRGPLSALNLLDTYAGLHPFFWMMFSPHFLLGQAASVLALLAILRAENSGRLGHSFLAGLAILLAGAMRPFDMLVLLVTGGFFLLANAFGRGERSPAQLFRRALPLLVPLPLLLYQHWLFSTHDVFHWWNLQNIALPPDPVSLLASLGLLGVASFFALGELGDARDKPPARLLMSCALIAALAVLYCYPLLMFTMQALTALVIPATLVATARWENGVTRLARSPRGAILVAVVLALHAGTSVALLTSRTQAAASGAARTPVALVEAYEWFDEHAEAREPVMASETSGNRIPRYSLATVFCGYAYSTVDVATKRRLVSGFYGDAQDDAARRALVARFGIRFVFHGPHERALGGWDPASVPWLRAVHGNDSVTIYEVAGT